jgi:hypothetical protein
MSEIFEKNEKAKKNLKKAKKKNNKVKSFFAF